MVCYDNVESTCYVFQKPGLGVGCIIVVDCKTEQCPCFVKTQFVNQVNNRGLNRFLFKNQRKQNKALM